VARGGRDTIDHAPNGHDDLSNAVASVVSLANKHGNYDVTYRAFAPDADDPDGSRAWRASQLQAYLAMHGGYGWS
jgi:hypothetical protein